MGKQASNLKGYDNVFAQNLRKLMERKDITQEELAKKAGCTRQAVSQYMDGSSVPNVDKLLGIADYFGVSIDYLLGRENKPNEKELINQISDYTGLSELAIENLHDNELPAVDFVDYLCTNMPCSFFMIALDTYIKTEKQYQNYIGNLINDKHIQPVIDKSADYSPDDLAVIYEWADKLEHSPEKDRDLADYRLKKRFDQLIDEYKESKGISIIRTRQNRETLTTINKQILNIFKIYEGESNGDDQETE